jgi:hypothetical protein
MTGDGGACDPAETVDHAVPGVREIVEDRDPVPRVNEGEIGVRSDIARTARQQNMPFRHARFRVLAPVRGFTQGHKAYSGGV